MDVNADFDNFTSALRSPTGYRRLYRMTNLDQGFSTGGDSATQATLDNV